MPRRRRSASKSASASRQGALSVGLSCSAMGLFFIDTDSGQVATQHQLLAAGVIELDVPPPRPWLRIQGTGDASTMWYAVMRRRERGVFIGTLVLRHSDHHTLLLERGWEEVPVAEIGPAEPGGGGGAAGHVAGEPDPPSDSQAM